MNSVQVQFNPALARHALKLGFPFSDKIKLAARVNSVADVLGTCELYGLDSFVWHGLREERVKDLVLGKYVKFKYKKTQNAEELGQGCVKSLNIAQQIE